MSTETNLAFMQSHYAFATPSLVNQTHSLEWRLLIRDYKRPSKRVWCNAYAFLSQGSPDFGDWRLVFNSYIRSVD